MVYVNFRMSPVPDLLLHFIYLFLCYYRPRSLHMKIEAENYKPSNKLMLKKVIRSRILL